MKRFSLEEIKSKFKRIEENPDLDKYISELYDDTFIDIENIREKSMLVSVVRCKWLNYYRFEKKSLERAMKIKEDHVKSKISSKGISDPLIRMKSKLSAENNDETVLKINNVIKNIKDNIEFIEMAMNILDDLPRTIYNTMELLKMEMK